MASLLLQTGVLGILRDDQLDDLRKLVGGGQANYTRLAGERLPDFPGALGYIGSKGEFLPYVLGQLEVMRAARCTPKDAAKVKMKDGKALLVPLQVYPDYNQQTDFESAMDSTSRLICMRAEKSPEGGGRRLVYTNSQGQAEAITVPLTMDIVTRLPSIAGGKDAVGIPLLARTLGSSSTSAPPKEPSWDELARKAALMHATYKKGFAFPACVIDMLGSGELELYARTAVVYHLKEDRLDVVKDIAFQREPANIAMERLYDAEKLQGHFGYREGAYRKSSSTGLMPNIAIYCRTPMGGEGYDQVDVHVINVIGYAFDSMHQPDYKYFFASGPPMASSKWQELVKRYSQIWTFVFECARRQGLKRVFLCSVGGGCFAYLLNKAKETRYDLLYRASLGPVLERYPDIKVRNLRDLSTHGFLDRLFTDWKPFLGESLLVNAWDPWSMVGNGNAGDESLDGRFGRCTAMGVLCWPGTNPFLRYESV
mmetsp:Transcript_18629/g.41890  ORF Transcript_18629/g.41890 Transcript_18629/m.41890 type:complete len:482 (+) Transcript_18629:92-1537(+)